MTSTDETDKEETPPVDTRMIPGQPVASVVRDYASRNNVSLDDAKGVRYIAKESGVSEEVMRNVLKGNDVSLWVVDRILTGLGEALAWYGVLSIWYYQPDQRPDYFPMLVQELSDIDLKEYEKAYANSVHD